MRIGVGRKAEVRMPWFLQWIPVDGERRRTRAAWVQSGWIDCLNTGEASRTSPNPGSRGGHFIHRTQLAGLLAGLTNPWADAGG